jgi:SAM-dependent methyltransferase
MTATSTPVAPARLCTTDGRVLDLPSHRWFAAAGAAEQRALDHVEGPVLDVGCGPGRHLVALAERKVFALGIDTCRPFLDVARTRGVNVLERSVFDRVPGAGRWRSALLFDGNIGIGGDPVALLGRVLELVCDDARIVVEIEPDDTEHEVLVVRAETDLDVGPWFHWTTVDQARLMSIAATVGVEVLDVWDREHRRFAVLAVSS